MLNKNKNNDIHSLIMDQLTDVENTLVALEGFIAAATAEGASIEPLRALCKTVREKEHIADVSLRTMIEGLDGPFLPSTRSDLISIATSCDKIANKCEDVAKLMVYQRFFFPADCNSSILEIIDITDNTEPEPVDFKYYINSGHIDHWHYSNDNAAKIIETKFGS